MIDQLCALPDREKYVLGLVAILVKEIFEFWLGRTPKVKAASTLELIYNMGVALMRRLITRKDEE